MLVVYTKYFLPHTKLLLVVGATCAHSFLQLFLRIGGDVTEIPLFMFFYGAFRRLDVPNKGL